MSLLRAVTFGLAILIAAPQAWSEARPVAAADDMQAIWDVLDMPTSLEIMREEGETVAEDLSRDYLSGRGGAGWERSVTAIYDPATMDALMRNAFAEDFGEANAGPVVSFFGSDLGQRIIGLELTARRAFMDPDTEAAAMEMMENGSIPDARMGQIRSFIDVNDLVSFNVSGALNTNLAFLSGLAESKLFEMSEGEILDQVYGNAESTRAETESWLRAYLTMAYQPLSDAELDAYIAFSETPEGQRLNRALFAGFGAMYDMQYNALGRAVAQQLAAQDL